MKNSKKLDNTAGVLCALGGEMLFGLSIIFTKRVTEYADAFSLLGWRFLIALVRAALRGSVAELIALPFNAPGFLAAVLYQGIGCSVLAFFLSNVAISKIGVNRTASFIGFSTVVSILAGALLLHESFTALQTVGVAVILAGVYIANITAKRTASN